MPEVVIVGESYFLLAFLGRVVSLLPVITSRERRTFGDLVGDKIKWPKAGYNWPICKALG